VAGGAAALGATSAYVVASLLLTFGTAPTDRRLEWAAKGGYLGGLFGILVLLYEALGVG
jgi:hypothetical protein